MEFTKQQIARLVLGYLKVESCNEAYTDFLQNSMHLKKYANSKYMVTRVNGMTLVDFLNEYAAIYTLVQERIETTNFYNEHNSYSGLIDQLLYLLEYGCFSRSSSPFSSTKNTTQNKITSSDVMESSLSKPVEQIEDYLTNSVPNDTFESNTNKTKRNKILSALKSNKCNLSKDEVDCRKPVENIPVEVLTQTLLEHHELHEKIAENINNVRNAPEANATTSNVPEDKMSSNVSTELENTIKTVVQKTESEPIFEKLINELLGIEINSASDQTDSHDEGNVHSVAETAVPKPVLNTDNKKRRFKRPHPKENNPQIDYGANQQSTNPVPVQNTISTSTGDVILYDGSMDNYMKTNIPITTVASSSNSLLMMSTPTNAIASNVISSSVQSNIAKPYYIVTGQAATNTGNSVLSEQDILSMPTVIVYEENQPIITPQPFIITPYGTNQVVNFVPNVKSMPPSTSCSDYVTLFHCSDSDEAENKNTSEVNCADDKKSAKVEENKDSTVPVTNKDPKPESIINSKSGPVLTTPSLPENVLADKKHSTPNSGSHIRVLNFNSPEKTSVQNKPETDDSKTKNKSAQTQAVKKGLFQTPKDAKAKENVKKSSAKKIAKVEQQKKDSDIVSWDSHLRALISNDANVTSNVQKRKKMNTPRKRKKISASKVNLNTTEHDGKLIEEALCQEQNEANIDKEAKSSEIAPVVENALKVSDTKETTESVKQPEKSDEVRVNNDKKPRYKKKCNVSEPIKQEVSVTKVKEVKELKFINDLTAHPQPSTSQAAPVTLENPSSEPLKANSLEVNNVQPKTTPEDPKETFTCESKNEMPFLDTPIKPLMRNEMIPKTPGYFSPINNTDTPFTRVLKEHLEGVDLNAIPTPQFPITPCIPITPGFENRPTDYSTSSSYYQPSDTEPSKSLEKQSIKEILDQEAKIKIDSTCAKRKVNIIDDIRIEPPNKIQLTEKSDENTPDPLIAQKLLTLSKNVIGRKDLSLVKSDHSCSCSSTDEESSEESSDESDSSSCSSSNDSTCSLVIAEKISPPQNVTRRYSLRLRASKDANLNKDKKLTETSAENASLDKDSKPNETPKSKENIQPNGKSNLKEDVMKAKSKSNENLAEDNSKSQECVSNEIVQSNEKSKPNGKNKPKKGTSPKKTIELAPKANAKTPVKKNEILTYKQRVLNEMEIKRKRMIEKIKNDTANTPKSNKKTNSSKSKQCDQNNVIKGRCTKSKTFSAKILKEKLSLEISLQANKVESKKINEKIDAVERNNSRCSENITLHLSSDDEHLEPFEVVEANLESSNSNHPVESTESKVYDISLQSFNKALESAKNKSLDTKKDEDSESAIKNGTSGKDAETLVRDLKERGIYLVPTKSFEKKPDKDLKEEISNTKSDCVKKVNEKDLNIEKSEKTESVSMLWAKLFNQQKTEILNEPVSKKDDDINEKIVTKIEKSEPQSLPKIDNEKDSSKIVGVDVSKSSKEPQVVDSDNPKLPKTDLNKSEIQSEIDFDVRNFDEETQIQVKHDENKKWTKTLKDYNFELLKKVLNAQVYMEEIDQEVERPISVTPFEFLLELPPKIPKQKSKSHGQKALKKTNESPLCDLYESSKDTKYNIKKSDKSETFKTNEIKDTKTNVKSSKSKSSKSITDIVDTLKEKHKGSPRKKVNKKDTRSKETNSGKNKVSEKSTKTIQDVSDKKNRNKEVGVSEVSFSKTLSSQHKVLNSEKSLEIITKTTESSQISFDENDALMNYAIIGSEREENPVETIKCDKSTKKRKASEEFDKSDKKSKTNDCQELIKKVGVDMLLKKLYGEK